MFYAMKQHSVSWCCRRRGFAPGLLLSALVLVLAGCGARAVVEPEPSALDADFTTARPAVVCGSQHVSAVMLESSGHDRLAREHQSGSQPPSVRLDLRVTPEGLAGDQSFQLPDDEQLSPVRWSSTGSLLLELGPRLGFGVDGGAGITPGLYDVVAYRGDGGRRLAAARGLSVVPPPLVQRTASVPCDDGSAGCVVVQGDWLLRLQGVQPTVSFTPAAGGATVVATASRTWGCRPLPAPSGVTLASCVLLQVEARLKPGTYHVAVQNPADAGCVSQEPVALVVHGHAGSPRQIP